MAGCVETSQTYERTAGLGLPFSVFTGVGGPVQVTIDSAGTELYEYNALNQLVSVNIDGVTTEYSYRPDGLRNSKAMFEGEAVHLWDGANIAADIAPGGGVTAYVRGIGLILADDGSESVYYLYNGHGDVIQLTDGTGAVTKTYDYDAFGVERAPDASDPNPFRYCGEYFDKETGSVYLRARYYNPRLGRFISEDPAYDGLNWYTYCENNPVKYL